MTIPYPKREFLNDDDSDSKSSAAKVIIINICPILNQLTVSLYWLNISIVQKGYSDDVGPTLVI